MEKYFEYGFKMSKNSVKVVTYEAVRECAQKDIFDFMFFVASQYQKHIINIFNKESMKISYKYAHCMPQTAEEALTFCEDKGCTFGMTYFCDIKDGFTRGFSIIKPHMAEAIIISAYEDESFVEPEEKMQELLVKFAEWRTNEK